MPSLEESLHPLVFRVANARGLGWTLPPGEVAPAPESPHFRVLSRSLQGMQKEAAVLSGGNEAAWRMVSDEGPYLNGTDLAPFPLAFFTTGLASAYLARLEDRIRDSGRDPGGLRVAIDSRYSMTGSALKGTMKGAALPVDVQAQISAGGLDAATMVAAAEGCLAFQLLRSPVEEEFGIRVNGRSVTPNGVPAFTSPLEASPDGFDEARPETDPQVSDAIIRKLASAPIVSGEGGAGSSLAGEQKRSLHLRGTASGTGGGMRQVRIELFRPVGSSFQFLSDDLGQRAPSALAYLSAALAFCFMTQLGRYAHIVRKPLDDYRVIQDLVFAPSGIGPLRTQVSLETPEGVDYGRTLVDMGAQTCFLHAACQARVGINLRPG